MNYSSMKEAPKISRWTCFVSTHNRQPSKATLTGYIFWTFVISSMSQKHIFFSMSLVESTKNKDDTVCHCIFAPTRWLPKDMALVSSVSLKIRRKLYKWRIKGVSGWKTIGSAWTVSESHIFKQQTIKQWSDTSSLVYQSTVRQSIIRNSLTGKVADKKLWKTMRKD